MIDGAINQDPVWPMTSLKLAADEVLLAVADRVSTNNVPRRIRPTRQGWENQYLKKCTIGEYAMNKKSVIFLVAVPVLFTNFSLAMAELITHSYEGMIVSTGGYGYEFHHFKLVILLK